MTAKEAAKKWRVNVRTVYRWIRDGLITIEFVGRRIEIDDKAKAPRLRR